MELISRTHKDSLYPDVNNVDHAQFQVILLHVLFEEGDLLGNINEEFIDFLTWLSQTLSIYGSIEKIEDINIEINHIKRLKELSLKINELCKDKSNEKCDPYVYLNNIQMQIG
ncbi:unnamed protein product [Rotaria sordida]|uniref:Uncharacterized protein n=1 Tax=Rotaria sordida TaxID=392033 RepID=A0A819UW88_9BILA|nr:unnamed protein product [Rotaria sordida]CAF4100265.1 unnamed protein product [Rotaria sordida]